MLIVFFRAVILYILIVISIRLMGKRQIGEMQPSELAVAIMISDLATVPVSDIAIPLLSGVIPIMTLIILKRRKCAVLFMTILLMRLKSAMLF